MGRKLDRSLVPPEAMNVEQECPNGTAFVETKHRVLIMLVGGLTSGIITPMHITVTCAEGATAFFNANVDQKLRHDS